VFTNCVRVYNMIFDPVHVTCAKDSSRQPSRSLSSPRTCYGWSSRSKAYQYYIQTFVFFNTRYLNELMIVTADVYRTIWIYSSQHWRVQQDLVQLTVNTPPCLLTASLAAARASYAVASSTSSSLLQLLVAVFSLSYQQEEAGYT